VTAPLFREDAYLRTCEARVLEAGPAGIVLDRTVFYPTGGGQPGDRGLLLAPGGVEIAILDTRKGEGEAILHLAAETAALPAPGSAVEARIDWERRHRLMRAHTALHLLCAAVGAPVTGGAVGELEGRLDFDLPEPPEREAIEARLNGWIADDRPVEALWVEEAELDARPELVKTLSVRPPRGAGRIRLVRIEGVDLQACGGTHVATTREIGRVRITKVEKKGRQNRRIAIAIED
jgi:misacylated tRNA(Ala) deacylase